MQGPLHIPRLRLVANEGLVVLATLMRRVVARRPAFALMAAVAVDVLRLVVEENDPRRKGHIDCSFVERTLDRCDHAAAGRHDIAAR
ncbi:MAG TPA: hypothetical protein VH743_18190 [Beijerinckiaceae bacterium]